MRPGDEIVLLGQSVLLGIISYKIVGFWGPASIVILFAVGFVLNFATRKTRRN
jgi:hypothetical protein